MKKVQGERFGVRFYRRGVVKTPAKTDMKKETDAPVVQDNAYTVPQPQPESADSMNDIVQPSSKRDIHPHQEHTAPQAPVAAQAAPKKNPKEEILWAAAKSGDLYTIRLLVMDGVDLEARDSQGRTAINIATQYGRTNALKTLLAAKEMRTMAKLGELPQTKFFEKFKPAKTGTE